VPKIRVECGSHINSIPSVPPQTPQKIGHLVEQTKIIGFYAGNAIQMV